MLHSFISLAGNTLYCVLWYTYMCCRLWAPCLCMGDSVCFFPRIFVRYDEEPGHRAFYFCCATSIALYSWCEKAICISTGQTMYVYSYIPAEIFNLSFRIPSYFTLGSGSRMLASSYTTKQNNIRRPEKA